MIEAPAIIRMNIVHYEALLKLDRFSERRADIERMLAEARIALAKQVAAADAVNTR